MVQLATQPPTQRLEIGIDRDSELSPGVQLTWRLRGLMAAGRMAAGARLPSVRELAGQAGVNVNTARSVYRRLEREGLVASVHGRGTFVTDAAARSTDLDRLAAEAIAEARAAGVDPRELATALYASAGAPAASAGEPVPASRVSPTLPQFDRDSENAAVRRDLRRQIARLEKELAEYAGDLSRDDADVPPIAPKPHVAGVEDLERVRNDLIERLAAVRDKQARRGRRQQRARARVEGMTRDPEGHKWQWVSSEETGDEGCNEWRVTPRYGPVGALMGWWRIKVSSGCP